MTTLNLQVAAGDDNGEQLGIAAVARLGGTAGNLGVLDADDEFGAWRFTGVTIANAATINAATTQHYFSSPDNDEPLHDLDFEASDDAPALVAATSNFSDRTLTGNPSTWDNTNLGGPGWFTSPSMATSLQAVVNRAGWSSGAAVVLVCVQPATAATRDWLTYNYNIDSTLAAKLDIDYTAGGANATATRSVAARGHSVRVLSPAGY